MRRRLGILLPPLLVLVACGMPNGAWVKTARPPADYSEAPALAVQADGTVIAAGGASFGGPIPNVYRYEPAPDRWSVEPAMPDARADFAAAALPGGGLLLAGGAGSQGGTGPELATADLYVPGSGWQAPLTMPGAAGSMTAVPLRDGKVMLLGGLSAEGPSDEAWLYDPTERMFHVLHPMPGAWAQPAAVELRDGRVLAVGYEGAPDARHSIAATVFDPGAGTWTSRPPPPVWGRPALSLLPSGAALLIVTQLGLPFNATALACFSLAPDGHAWTALPCPAGSLLPLAVLASDSGAALVAFRATDGTTVVDRYDAATEQWTSGPPLNGGPALGSNAVALPSGRLLVLTELAYAVFDPGQDSYPGIGGPLASPELTAGEGGAAALLLLLLGVRWRRSAAQREAGGAGELG